MKKKASSIEKDIEKILNCENLDKPRSTQTINQKGNKHDEVCCILH